MEMLFDGPIATEFYLSATDGEMVRVFHVGAIETMPKWGRIANGWLSGVENFDKYDDGDVVLECEESHPSAMSWADAHQQLTKDIDDYSAESFAEGIRSGYWTREAALARIHPARPRVLAMVLHLVDGAEHPDVTAALAKQDVKPLSYNPFQDLKR